MWSTRPAATPPCWSAPRRRGPAGAVVLAADARRRQRLRPAPRRHDRAAPCHRGRAHPRRRREAPHRPGRDLRHLRGERPARLPQRRRRTGRDDHGRLHPARAETARLAARADAAAVSVRRMRAPIGNFDRRPARRRLPRPAHRARSPTPYAPGRATSPPSSCSTSTPIPEIADTAVFVEHYGADLLETVGQLRRRRGQAGRRVARSPPAWSSPAPASTSTAWSAANSARARPRSRPWTPRSARPAWSTAASRPSGCPPAGRCWSTPPWSTLPWALIGSGRRRGKLIVPGKAFAELPGASSWRAWGLTRNLSRDGSDRGTVRASAR